MLFFFSAGEPSGDIHAAELIEKIRKYLPAAEFVGFGGPRMEAAGCSLLHDMTKMAVMWGFQVISRYLTFRRLVGEAKRYFRTNKVDAVVLVDYPGFNWHIAKAAKERGIPVYYFMPPQIWAWAQWRIKKMRKNVDVVLCALPFEYHWLWQRGCRCVYIGHPFFEEIRTKKSDPAFLEHFYKEHGDGPVLTILPGSRNQEVVANLDDMLNTVEKVRSLQCNVKPVIAAFSEEQMIYIHDRQKELKTSVPIFVGRTTELIRAADCCLAVSGSVSLELLACNKPTVIYYRVGKWPMLIQRFFRRTRYITLVNLLAVDRLHLQQRDPWGRSPLFYEDSQRIIPAEPGPVDRSRMLFPEFLTATDRSNDAAAHLIYWLSDPAHLAAQKRLLDELLCDVDTVESPLKRAALTLLALGG